MRATFSLLVILVLATLLSGQSKQNTRPGRETTGLSAASGEARQLYQQGLSALAKTTPEDWFKAAEHFRQAISKDPRFAPAHVGLAEAYIRLEGPNAVEPTEALTKAKSAAAEAVRLDGKLAEARSALGWVKFLLDREWKEAGRDLKRAVELKPSDARVRQRYAEYLAARGRFDEALAEMSRAQEIDPRSPAVSRDIGRILFFARRYDEAVAQYQKTLQQFPDYGSTRFWLGLAYIQTSRTSEAIAELEKRVAGSTYRIPGAVLSLAHAYAAVGRMDEARKLLGEAVEGEKRGPILGYQMATVYAALGDKEQALKNLEHAIETGDKYLVWLKLDPRLDGLRSDSRFQKILRRAGHRP